MILATTVLEQMPLSLDEMFNDIASLIARMSTKTCNQQAEKPKQLQSGYALRGTIVVAMAGDFDK